MRKLKNRRIPNGTYGGVRGRRAEARLLLDGRRLSNRGCAANGILMTLSPKRGNDAAGGSLPRRELPTGLRDGDGSAAGWRPRPQSRPISTRGCICREAAERVNAQDPIHPQDNLLHMDFDKSRTSSYRKDKENT